MRVTQEQTESEWKKVEQTERREFIRCDVCGHDHTEEEWSGKEFSVDPEIERDVGSLTELGDMFSVYHTSIPRHVIDDGYDGVEMTFDVPSTSFIKALSEESELIVERSRRSEQEQLAIEALKTEYAEKIGSRDIYIKDGDIHHFRYVIDIDSTTEDHKHVCTECYDVVFD